MCQSGPVANLGLYQSVSTPQSCPQGISALAAKSRGNYLLPEDEMAASQMFRAGVARLSSEPGTEQLIESLKSTSRLPEIVLAQYKALDRITDPLDPIWLNKDTKK